MYNKDEHILESTTKKWDSAINQRGNGRKSKSFSTDFFIWHRFSRLEFSPLVFHSAAFSLLASVVSFIPSFFQALVSDAGMYIILVMLGTETVYRLFKDTGRSSLVPLFIYSTNCFIVADPDFVRFSATKPNTSAELQIMTTASCFSCVYRLL